MNSDLIELLRCLKEFKVKYLIIGGQAVIYYAEPRYTKDVDILVEASKSNSKRLIAALKEFGAPTDNLTEEDFSTPGTLYVFGLPPNRVDILTSATGVDFKSAWKNRTRIVLKKVPAYFCSKKDLIKMKKAAGRLQDLVDLESLGEKLNNKQIKTLRGKT